MLLQAAAKGENAAPAAPTPSAPAASSAPAVKKDYTDCRLQVS